MKKIIVIGMLLLLAGLRGDSQDNTLPKGKATIIMKDDSHIGDVQLWRIHSAVLEYEQDGNLHDAPIAEIKDIEAVGEEWFIDSSGALKIIQTDLIITADSDTIRCKIKMINNVYSFIDFQRKGIRPETYDSRLAFVKVKKYSINGEEHVISQDSSDCPGVSTPQTDTVQSQYYYKMGMTDASKYYDGSGAAVGGLVSGLTPFWGWCIAFPIFLCTDPQMYNHGNSNANVKLMSNKDYYQGYHKKAKSKKMTNVLVGFGLGLAAFLAIVL